MKKWQQGKSRTGEQKDKGGFQKIELEGGGGGEGGRRGLNYLAAMRDQKLKEKRFRGELNMAARWRVREEKEKP